MGLGTNLTLTPQYSGHKIKESAENAQTRINELLVGQNGLNTDTRAELEKLQDTIYDMMGYSQFTLTDKVVGDNYIEVNTLDGLDVGDIVTILDIDYIIEMFQTGDNPKIYVKDGLTTDVPTGTEVTKASTLDLAELTSKMQTLSDIFSKTGTANDVFDALVILADAWNDGADLTAGIEGVFNSATGVITIDLTSFGFASIDDYKFSGSVDKIGARYTSTGFDKVSETTAEVTAYDRSCFVEDNILFDATTTTFKVSMSIVYNRPHLSFSITDEENNTTEVV